MKVKEKMIANKTMIESEERDTMYLIACRWSGLRQAEHQQTKNEANDTGVKVNSVLLHYIERYPFYSTTRFRVNRVMSPTAQTYRRLMRGDTASKLLFKHYGIEYDSACKLIPKETTDYNLRYVSKKSIEEDAGGIQNAYDYFKPYLDLVTRRGMVITHNNVNDPYTESLRAVESLSVSTSSEAAYNARKNAMALYEDGIKAIWAEHGDEWARARDDREFHKEGKNFVYSVQQSWTSIDKANYAVKSYGDKLSNSIVKITKQGGFRECVDACMRNTFEGWVARDYDTRNNDNSKKHSLQDLRRAVDFSNWDLLKTPISKNYNDYSNDDERELGQLYLKNYGKAVGYLMSIENNFMVDLLSDLSSNYRYRHINNVLDVVVDWEEYPLLSLLFGVGENKSRHEIGQSIRTIDENGNYIRDENDNFVYETLLPNKECLHEEAEKFKSAWIYFFADKSKYQQAYSDAMERQRNLHEVAKNTKEEVLSILEEKGLITKGEGEKV